MALTGNWVRVAAIDEIAAGSALGVTVGDLNLAIYHLDDGRVFCTDNICTHAFALLTDGWMEGTTIECPLHAGQFDVCTGKGLGAPIEEDLKSFPVRVEGGEIMVEIAN
ncbi:MAG: non-heme iron oxygenase ferredoxin subunit [Acetobacteraceae bacterium]|nr:non-heme iron oxygenase ferredoxin subunit [Acetobacteraceae bacterium]